MTWHANPFQISINGMKIQDFRNISFFVNHWHRLTFWSILNIGLLVHPQHTVLHLNSLNSSATLLNGLQCPKKQNSLPYRRLTYTSNIKDGGLEGTLLIRFPKTPLSLFANFSPTLSSLSLPTCRLSWAGPILLDKLQLQSCSKPVGAETTISCKVMELSAVLFHSSRPIGTNTSHNNPYQFHLMHWNPQSTRRASRLGHWSTTLERGIECHSRQDHSPQSETKESLISYDHWPMLLQLPLESTTATPWAWYPHQ